ncbi:atp synthase subunit a [Leptolyngbya sp. Heron Island J]|uniref:V-type ATP synthase subunit A n=1 Tax=Leptolyngbya sp. Heron Island J TaxID=1385935 RepID=UPI0003B9BA9B|nr:V-type ATP synthase subunit A [Leptolyngbya sp. Heron Island J]ESA33648.1 atp synthase subunit a [Leptolyngbya sp. Heron Island J]
MSEMYKPARVVAVQEDIVTIKMAPTDGRPLTKNEVVYISPQRRNEGRTEKLKAEVLRVRGYEADAQVFESTRGVGIGDPVEQTGQLLSVSLGPGLLGQVYDGLQNPLDLLAVSYGTFLPRGVDVKALDERKKWSFVPTVHLGAQLKAGDTLGTVQEGRFRHKIMVPFDQPGEVELIWIQQGSFTVNTPIARIREANGREHTLDMTQQWPVRRSVPQRLLTQRFSERLYPDEPLMTTQRIIDTFFPIARGGTACIPGPFGAGKTVLQHTLSRYAAVDIVLVVACGERAGEVVETITEFPELKDPKTGASLMERTIIICNTSSMPVASREASIYTGITLGEYYRQMGYDVLLLADSTSRWAQAMRETSGRMEEIPGEEAFPAYLDSSIKGVYERSGVIRTNDGSVGSLTMVGTVSPAGGNFEEPVTQSTMSTVKTFLGLSYDRAYKRFYPAIDPLISWSRYLTQLTPWLKKEIAPDWVDQIQAMNNLLKQGDSIYQMMQVTGEDGVTLDDYVTHQKSLFLDMVYLQQDAFDAIDSSTPLARQKESFGLVNDLVTRCYQFENKASARDYFTHLTGLYKNLNYTQKKSPEYTDYLKQIHHLADAVTLSELSQLE